MVSNSIRPAAVAGSWYPGTHDALLRDVDGYLAAVPADAVPRGRLDAVIAPHAGLMFSGPVGAFAYKTAAACGPFETVILVGPSHFVAFDGVAVYPSGAFESPLGPAAIDDGLARELVAASPAIRALPAAHAREHSLEMQLPFVRRLLPDARIVPMLMGYQTRATIEELANVLSGITGKVLMVASTDLSHYFDAARAEDLDARVGACVNALDPDGLLTLFEEYPEGERGRFVACGGGPAIAVMLAARARGARHGRVLKYMHSGQISGDNSGVVGYLAGALGTFSERASASEPRDPPSPRVAASAGQGGAGGRTPRARERNGAARARPRNGASQPGCRGPRRPKRRLGVYGGAKPPVKNDVH